jgi:carboxyl-terminal processing protease
VNKKISLGLAVSLIFLAVAITITATMLVAMGVYNDIIKDVSARSGVYSTVSELDELIRKNYYGEINENLLNAMMSDGYVAGIGDKYSYYMTPNDYARYKEEEKGNKVGIGVVAVYDSKNNNIYISEVSAGSPAQIQGISKGDVITAVDGVGVTASNYKDLLESLEGAKLTNVQVTFVHNGTENTVSVARGYSAQTVYYSVMEDVGYIKINAFYSTTAKELESALKYMMDKNIASVIFDVSNNNTGLITNVVKCIDMIVPVATEGTNAVATAVDKNGNIIETFASDSDSVNFTMIVLVNSNTSGAAELFACDLRDFGLARIVGVKTAGNGTMQKVFELNDGSAVALTVAKILPYKSNSFNGVGLEPDFVVELSAEQNERLEMLTYEEDLQYQKAMDILGNK